MPFKGNDFQHTRGEGYAAITDGIYGQDYDEKLDAIVDVENGARKYWADQLREKAETVPQDERAGLLRAADLLDPYTTKHPVKDAAFARTTLTDAPEGQKWITPNAE